VADKGSFQRACRARLRQHLCSVPTQLRTDLLFVAIVVLAALGVSSFMLFGYLERMATRGERTEETR